MATAIVVVYDDRIIFLKGYGHARFNPNVEVDPAWTRFHIGSVTKPAILLPAFALTVWRERWWTSGERLAHSTLAAFAVILWCF